MALPGLKPSIELESDERGVRLVEREAGTTLPLSELEAALLHAWDGVAGATALADLVLLQGLSVEPRQVEQFFARLERSRLLVTTAPQVPYVPATSVGGEAEDDVVPLLRSDLVITPSKTSRGTLEVMDPTCERAFTLYDFEVSIARMLDGRRTVGEVITASNRLGIPVTLATLRTFLQQLRAYQFIDTNAQPAGDSTWAPRKQWTVEVRELYQSALRLMRAGRFDEARSYVDAMAAADPASDEATALRQRIDAEALGSRELNVPFDELHTPVTTAAVVLDGPDPTVSHAPISLTTPHDEAPAPPKPLSLHTTPYGGAPLEVVSLAMPTAPPKPKPEQVRPISLRTTPYGAPMLQPPDPDARIVRGGAAAEQHDAGVPLPLTAAPVVEAPLPATTPYGLPSASAEPPTAPAMWPENEAKPGDPFASFGFHSAPPPTETLTPMPSGLYKTVPAPEVPKRSRRWPVVVGLLVVVAVIAGVLLRPVEVRRSIPCELRAEVLGAAVAPREGVVKVADVKHGDVVEAGAVLARLEDSLDDAPAVFDERIAAAEKERAALPKAVPAKLKKARAAVKKAELALKVSQKGLARLTGAKLAAANKKVELKQRAVDKAQAAVEAMTQDTKRADLEQRIAELQTEKKNALASRERSAIEAPVGGVVLLPPTFPVVVKESGEFATLMSPTLRVVSKEEVPTQVKSGTLRIGSTEQAFTIARANEALGVVPFEPSLVDASATLEVSGGTKPWVLTLR